MTDTADLGRPSVRGGAWLLARQVSINVVRIVTLGILARQLDPAEFGLVALATVLLRFVVLFSEGGIGTYVVYYRGADWHDHVRAAFWLNFATTMGQIALCLLALPVATAVYDVPDLAPVFLAMLWVFFVQQAGVVPMALLQRQLRFRVLAGRDMAVQLASAVLSVVLALRGWGVWSLVVPNMVFEPVRVIVAMAAARWQPGRDPVTRLWRTVFRYVKHLMASNLLQLVLNDGDTLVVGRVFTSAALGIYNLAWQLANLVGRNLSAIVGDVGLAALAESSENPGRLRHNYLRMIRVLAAASFPALLFLFVAAEQVVDVVYGPKYADVVPVLRIFVLFTLVRSVTSPIGTLFNVVGRPDLGLALTAATVPPYIAAVVIGSNWGIEGVAAGVAVVRTAGAAVGWVMSVRLVGASPTKEATAFARIAAAAGATALAAWAVITVIDNDVAAVVIGAAVAALAYLGALALLDRRSLSELRAIARMLGPSASRSAPEARP